MNDQPETSLHDSKKPTFKKSVDEQHEILSTIKEFKVKGYFTKNEQVAIAVIDEKAIKLGGIEYISNTTMRKIADFLTILSDKSDKIVMETPAFKDIISDLNKDIGAGAYKGIASINSLKTNKQLIHQH